MGKMWFDAKDFWKEMFDFIFKQASPEVTKSEVDGMVSLLKIDENSTVLDSFCGYGRHAIMISKVSKEVIGVDLSDYLIEMANKEKDNLKIQNISFIKQDGKDYQDPNRFDFIVNMFNSFGYYENKNDDIKLLESYFNSLKKGGKLLISMEGKETLLKKFVPNSVINFQDKKIIIEREIKNNFSWVENKWTVFNSSNKYLNTYFVCVRPYTAIEIEEVVRQVGFKSVSIFGDWNEEAYGINSKKMIVVAEK